MAEQKRHENEKQKDRRKNPEPRRPMAGFLRSWQSGLFHRSYLPSVVTPQAGKFVCAISVRAAFDSGDKVLGIAVKSAAAQIDVVA